MCRQQQLAHAVVVVQPGLCAPADMKGGVDVRFTEVHDLAQLVPIVHLLKIHGLHRRAGDDHAVVAIVLYLVFVMHRERALAQHIRPLEILILNLMPTKIATETQIARLLANTPLQVHMTKTFSSYRASKAGKVLGMISGIGWLLLC